MKNILHISDIHVSDIPTSGMNEHELGKLLLSLIDDLTELPPVDTILITGDIAYSGKEPEYEIFSNKFLTPLLSKLKIDTTRVFITPGNHDSSRKDLKKADQLIRAGLIADPKQSSIEEIIREKIDDQSYSWSPNFTSMRDEFDSPKDNHIVSNKIFSAYAIDGVGIGCVNTAWLAYSDDKEKLFVSEWQITEVINALKPFNQKIIIMHHPLDWLHPEDKMMLMNRLHSSKINCIFYGHMHEFWMSKESIFSEDSVLKLQAGRLDTSKNPNLCGYSLIALHEQNTFESGEIHFRKFDSQKSKFRSWTERVSNGKVSYSLTNSLPFDPERFCDCCSTIISNIEFDLLCNTGLANDQRKRLSEIFVLPTLAIESENGLTEDSFSAKAISGAPTKYHSLSSLSESSESLIILGGENSGKSTLAKRLSLHYLSNQSAQNLENIVFYLDLKGKTFKNSKKIDSELLSFYLAEGKEPTFQAKIEKKLSGAGAVIILDSIESLETHSLKILFEYISASPARFLIFSQLSARPILRELSTGISSKKIFRYLNIKSLKRNNLKELINKWNPTKTSSQTSKATANALKIVSSTGMANNPFVYTMLLSIRERKSTSYRTYMHEADLVENFIEIIMQKHVIPTGNVPQYKDVLLFLGYVADHMHKHSTYLISDNALLQNALNFNRLITQDFGANSYIEPILRSGIMRKEGEQYKFSQICFFNYALAYWISKQTIEYSVLDQQFDFVRFDKVIEYISAIKSDPKLLDHLAQKVETAWTNLVAAENLSDLENAESELLNCAGHDIIDIVKQDALESSFDCPQESEHEQNEKLDQSAPLRDQPLMSVKDTPNYVNPIAEFHETLSLYARAFRSAEHILDTDATHLHFSNIFQYYNKSVAFNVRAFNRDGRTIIIDTIKTLLEYEKIEKGKRGEIEAQANAFINFVIAVIPNWGVAMMSSDFFNQRQRQRMKLHRDEITNNLDKILLTYCLCELDDVNIVDELKSQKYETRHESSSVILKLYEFIFFNFSISDAEKEKLQKFADKLIKDRKTNQLFLNYTAAAKKMGQNAGVVTD